MHIRLVKGQMFLTEASRRRLESLEYLNVENAQEKLQQQFPNHLVFLRDDRLNLSNRDKSLVIAEFRPV